MESLKNYVMESFKENDEVNEGKEKITDLDITKKGGYGQYEVSGVYKGKKLKAHTTDSECYDWLNDDSDKKKHKEAIQHAEMKILQAYDNLNEGKETEQIDEANITSDTQFTEYAETVLKNAHGDNYDETKAKASIDAILKGADGDYGVAVGMLQSSLG